MTKMIVLGFEGRWTWLIWLRGTAVWERGSEFKGTIDVRGECQSQGVYLCLNFGKRPCRRTLFKNPHMTAEIITGVSVKIWIW
jgi:hypothetical protein